MKRRLLAIGGGVVIGVVTADLFWLANQYIL